MTNSTYSVQVQNNHYSHSSGYLSPARWTTNALIIKMILELRPKKILEIGPGPGTVTSALRQLGFNVKTLDLDPALKPDFLNSFTEANISEIIGQYDMIIASEVFEHVKYEDFLKSLESLKTSTLRILFTIPDTNEGAFVFGFRLRLPLYNEIQKVFKIRYKILSHFFNGEHYWEVGKKNYPASKIRKDVSAHWKILKEHINIDQPYHRFYLIEKI